MKKILILVATFVALAACTESERPAAQAKHALNAAQEAADATAKQAQDMADRAQEQIDQNAN